MITHGHSRVNAFHWVQMHIKQVSQTRALGKSMQNAFAWIIWQDQDVHILLLNGKITKTILKGGHRFFGHFRKRQKTNGELGVLCTDRLKNGWARVVMQGCGKKKQKRAMFRKATINFWENGTWWASFLTPKNNRNWIEKVYNECPRYKLQLWG